MSNCAWLNAWRRKGNEILLLPAWAHVTGTSPPPWESLEELSSWVCSPGDPELQSPLFPDLFVQWSPTVFLILSLDKFLLLGRVSSIVILMPSSSSSDLCWRCSWLLSVPEMARERPLLPLSLPVLYLFCILWWSAANAEVFSITLSKRIPCRNW